MTDSSARGMPAQSILSSSAVIVAFAADDAYAVPLSAAVASLIGNLGVSRKASIFIIDGGIGAANKDRILQLSDGEKSRIQFIRPSESLTGQLQSLPTGYVGQSAYYKLFLPDLLGADHSRILYLDSDVIVEGDVHEL